MNEILIALITGGCSIIAVILTNRSANDKMMQSMNINQAVTDSKIEELTREVREHNNFAKRVPLLEKDMEYLKDQVRDLSEAEK